MTGVTMGEGWHNNHHAFQSSARQGFKWWEIDMTYNILWALSRLGIV
jgi:stearoyl-CoA desaturase (delta-9 desaturase)